MNENESNLNNTFAGASRDTNVALIQPVRDGLTTYMGISPFTQRPMHVTDSPCWAMKWAEAMDYAGRYKKYEKPLFGFRLPTDDELRVIFENTPKIKYSPTCISHFWASNQIGSEGHHVLDFKDGAKGVKSEKEFAFVRLVLS